jgi:hypothetical protein
MGSVEQMWSYPFHDSKVILLNIESRIYLTNSGKRKVGFCWNIYARVRSSQEDPAEDRGWLTTRVAVTWSGTSRLAANTRAPSFFPSPRREEEKERQIEPRLCTSLSRRGYLPCVSNVSRYLVFPTDSCCHGSESKLYFDKVRPCQIDELPASSQRLSLPGTIKLRI